MARVLHVFKGDHAAEAVAVIRLQTAGDQVDVVLLAGAQAPALPEGVTVHRVPEDASYDRLVELIFTADHVVTW
jgi:surfactin synthase thioesterase subunit